MLLRRSTEGWPNSILRLAVDGANKQFVAHRHVQSLVNEGTPSADRNHGDRQPRRSLRARVPEVVAAWRGFYVGSKWALPRHASGLPVVLMFVPLIGCLEAVTPQAVVGLPSGSDGPTRLQYILPCARAGSQHPTSMYHIRL